MKASEERAEAARARFMRENWSLLNPSKEEVVRVVEKIVEREMENAEEEKDDGTTELIEALVNEIKALRVAVASAQPNPAPIVNVSPSLSPAPYVNVQPTVSVDTHREWEVTVEHHKSGPLQGKIWKANFRALS